jgi:hypothetical protein
MRHLSPLAFLFAPAALLAAAPATAKLSPA